MDTNLYFPPYAQAWLRQGLAHLVPCLDVAPANVRQTGWRAHGYPEGFVRPVVPGAPPYDGLHRASWMSPGICVVLHMRLPMIGDSLRSWLSANLSDQVGGDGNVFEFGIEYGSQRKNVESAVKALAAKIPAQFDE